MYNHLFQKNKPPRRKQRGIDDEANFQRPKGRGIRPEEIKYYGRNATQCGMVIFSTRRNLLAILRKKVNFKVLFLFVAMVFLIFTTNGYAETSPTKMLDQIFTTDLDNQKNLRFGGFNSYDEYNWALTSLFVRGIGITIGMRLFILNHNPLSIVVGTCAFTMTMSNQEISLMTSQGLAFLNPLAYRLGRLVWGETDSFYYRHRRTTNILIPKGIDFDFGYDIQPQAFKRWITQPALGIETRQAFCPQYDTDIGCIGREFLVTWIDKKLPACTKTDFPNLNIIILPDSYYPPDLIDFPENYDASGNNKIVEMDCPLHEKSSFKLLRMKTLSPPPAESIPNIV